MIKYQWNMEDIKKDPIIYNLIKEQDMEAQGTGPYIPPLKPYERLLNNFYYTYKNKFLKDYCNQAVDYFIKKMKGNTEIPKYISPEISFDDSMIITHDFYNEVLKSNHKLLNTFNKHFANSYKLIRTTDLYEYAENDGMTYYSSKLKTAYISISLHKPLNDLLTLVHEYGHVISMQHFDFADSNQPLGECDAVFMEYLALEYLQKQNIFKKDCKKLKKSIIQEYILNMIALDYNFDYYRGLQEYFEDYETFNFNKKNLVNIIMEYTGASKNEVLNNSEFQISNQIFYIVADLFGFDFVNIYREDPEKAINIYYNVLKLATQEEYNTEKCFNKVKKLGLNPANSFLRF